MSPAQRGTSTSFTKVDDHEAHQVAAALRRALKEQDLITHDTERPPLDHHVVTVDPTTGADCTVKVLADGGRLHDRLTPDIEPVPHPNDLATDKVPTLRGRARPRDFFDIAALIDRHRHDRLLELAEAKDNEFTHETFIDALRANAQPSNTDWTEDGITNDDAQRLRTTFNAWRNQLTLEAICTAPA